MTVAPKTLETLLLDVIQQQGLATSSVTALQASVNMLLEDRKEARNSRRAIHDSINQLTTQHVRLEELPAKVAELDERVDTLEGYTDQARGAARLSKVAWTVLASSGVVAAGTWVWNHIRW